MEVINMYSFQKLSEILSEKKQHYDYCHGQKHPYTSQSHEKHFVEDPGPVHACNNHTKFELDRIRTEQECENTTFSFDLSGIAMTLKNGNWKWVRLVEWWSHKFWKRSLDRSQRNSERSGFCHSQMARLALITILTHMICHVMNTTHETHGDYTHCLVHSGC